MRRMRARISPLRQRARLFVAGAALAFLAITAIQGASALLLAGADRATWAADTEAVTLSTLRFGFHQARLTEADIANGEPSREHQDAIADMRRALDRMSDGTGVLAAGTGRLRWAIDAYAAEHDG